MSKRKDLAPKEAAQRLSVRLDSVYSLIWAGKLEAHKLDGRWRVSADAVDERLRAREAGRGTIGR
jgi:excisionase family DNA binding protein